MAVSIFSPAFDARLNKSEPLQAQSSQDVPNNSFIYLPVYKVSKSNSLFQLLLMNKIHLFLIFYIYILYHNFFKKSNFDRCPTFVDKRSCLLVACMLQAAFVAYVCAAVMKI